VCIPVASWHASKISAGELCFAVIINMSLIFINDLSLIFIASYSAVGCSSASKFSAVDVFIYVTRGVSFTFLLWKILREFYGKVKDDLLAISRRSTKTQKISITSDTTLWAELANGRHEHFCSPILRVASVESMRIS